MGFRKAALGLHVTIALLGLAAAGCAAEPAEATLEPSELAARIEAGASPRLLDVRTAEEFARGHVPGAVNIPIDQLRGRLAELGADREGEWVVYCERGPRAERAAAALQAAGFTGLRLL